MATRVRLSTDRRSPTSLKIKIIVPDGAWFHLTRLTLPGWECIMTSVGGLLGASPVSRAAVLEERYRGRLPETLDDLTGPGHGTVQLPSHIAWSGLTAFDVDRPPLCASMYQIVLTEGLREDLAAYLNRRLLIRQWPMLRTIVGRVIRDVWEAAFPELTEGLPVRS